MHASLRTRRRLPIGAEVIDGGVDFRVWAPAHGRVGVVIDGGPQLTLQPAEDGYHEGYVAGVAAGARYEYRLGGGGYPDPASRFQPQGVHGPSQVVDAAAYRWADDGWRGLVAKGQVLYELHCGTFTAEGTWRAALRELPALADLGVTAIEIMPVAEFAGRFGWGYDGVALFAPTRLYGEPDDLRRFVDGAHALGLGVVLDVVYNHLGPDGNHLAEYAPHYFTDRYPNEWGAAINFDGESSAPVREFFLANARYWIEEYHLDGLRLDATQQIFDAGEPHILAELVRTIRSAAGARGTLVIGENEPQQARLLRPPARGGYGLDMLWNDDFHHSALVAVTGRSDAYYSDHRGSAQELISAARWGFLFQGQHYDWQKQRRGSPAFDVAAHGFVNYLQNHDQVANSAAGERIHQLTSPGRCRALTALLLLAPGTPLLFQGQEYAATTPFLYFADHKPEIATNVRTGRASFLTQFPALATAAMQERLAHPDDARTVERCRLDAAERARNRQALALHRDLLRLRRTERVFAAQEAAQLHGAVLGPEAFVLRWFDDAGDRLLLVNLGRDLRYSPAPEPLLAPPAEGARWRVLWSSEDPRYGGGGIVEPEHAGGWRVPGHAAIVLTPNPDEDGDGERKHD